MFFVKFTERKRRVNDIETYVPCCHLLWEAGLRLKSPVAFLSFLLMSVSCCHIFSSTLYSVYVLSAGSRNEYVFLLGLVCTIVFPALACALSDSTSVQRYE